MLGACCVRKPKAKLPPVGQNDSWQNEYNVSDQDGAASVGNGRHPSGNESRHKDTTVVASKSAEEGGCDEDSHFLYTCKYLSRLRCQGLVKGLPGGAAVVSFSPGEKCSEVGCGEGCSCLSQQQQQQQNHGQYSRRLKRGCLQGVCAGVGGGKRDACVCAHLTRRKEIRDLTVKEVKLYQRAVRRLRAKPGRQMQHYRVTTVHAMLAKFATVKKVKKLARL